MQEKKSEFLTIRITPQQKGEILKRAEEERRKPADLVYIWTVERLENLKR